MQLQPGRLGQLVMVQFIEMLQKVDLGRIWDEKTEKYFDVFAMVGEKSKEFSGITIESNGNVVRQIFFNEFNRIKKTLEAWGAS